MITKRPIPKFEYLYEIDEYGVIYSLTHFRIVKPILSNAGYFIVRLYRKGNCYAFLIHRLVALTFIPNDKNKKCVNHKDGNRLNNHVSNLEWSTHSENTQHALKSGISFKRKHEIFGEAHHNSKIREIDVPEIRKAYSEFGNVSVIARKFNVAVPTIRNIIIGNTWKHVK